MSEQCPKCKLIVSLNNFTRCSKVDCHYISTDQNQIIEDDAIESSEYEIDYSRLPYHSVDSLRGYIEMRSPVGGFLTSVLENDLQWAVIKADEVNAGRLKDYINFLNSQAPSLCWGSPAKVKAWLNGETGKG